MLHLKHALFIILITEEKDIHRRKRVLEQPMGRMMIRPYPEIVSQFPNTEPFVANRFFKYTITLSLL